LTEQKTNDVYKCSPEECQSIARQAIATNTLFADEQNLKNRALLFKALGNETRLRILGLLSVQELCTCDIVGALNGAFSTVTFHLRMLEDAGLISSRHVGKFNLYRLEGRVLEWHRVFEQVIEQPILNDFS